MFDKIEESMIHYSRKGQSYLTINAPRKNASKKVVCWSRLLQIIA